MSALALAADGPPLAPVRLRTLVRTLGSALEGFGSTRPANASELLVLTARLDVLGQWVEPGPLARIRTAVAFMLSNWYPGRSQLGRERAELIVHNYCLVLEPLPAWTVTRGCLALVRGQVPGVNPDFPPSSARTYATARGELEPVLAEQTCILAIVRAAHYCSSNGR